MRSKRKISKKRSSRSKKRSSRYKKDGIEFKDMAKTICNDISNYITGVIPLESNSASRTDTYILNFKDGVTFNNIPVNKGFMKIYLNMNDNSNLDYEARIYSEITNKILLLNINPGFVLNYAYVKGCTLDNILSMFKGLKDKNNKELTNEIIKLHFIRNMCYTTNETANRPALNNDKHSSKFTIEGDELEDINKCIKNGSITSIRNNYKYNYMINEAMKMDSTKTLSDILQNIKNDNDYVLYQLLFLISTSLYALFLSKVTHNDLHEGNIYIETLRTEVYQIYYINDNQYVIKTKYKIKIYDYDMSYAQRLGDNIFLNSPDNRCVISQCNQVFEQMDIVKISCYIYKKVSTIIGRRDKFLNCISSEKSIKEKLNIFYSNPKAECKFSRDFEKEKSNFLKNCYSLETIIQNFYNNITSFGTVKNNVQIPVSIYVCNKSDFDDNGNIKIEQYNIRYNHFKLGNITITPNLTKTSFPVVKPVVKK